MKTHFFKTALLVAFVLSSSITFAQRGDIGTPEERANRQTVRMKEKLHLSTEQENAVAGINLKYAKQNQSLLETGGRNLRTARQVQNQTKQKDAELKKVLNTDQYNEYLAIKEEMKRELKERRKQK